MNLNRGSPIIDDVINFLWKRFLFCSWNTSRVAMAPTIIIFLIRTIYGPTFNLISYTETGMKQSLGTLKQSQVRIRLGVCTSTALVQEAIFSAKI